jgi:multiple antibiotic resistance protein
MAITLLIEALRSSSLTFAALFPIINPLGVAPIFLSLTRAYPEQVRKLLARKIALYGFLLMGGSLALGSEVLQFFGISLSTIQMAGGFVLANTGWSMLNQKSAGAEQGLPSGSVEDAMQHAFYPLTLPLTVGPGCISVAIALGAHVRQQSTAARIDHLPPFLGGLFGMALVCVVLSLCYQHASKLEKFLGPRGTNIVIRLSAFLLLAMGVQIMWNGLTAAVATLRA